MRRGGEVGMSGFRSGAEQVGALSHDLCKELEHIGEVALDFILDADGGDDQVEITAGYALESIVERLMQRNARLNLGDYLRGFCTHRRGQVAGDNFKALLKVVAGTKRI